MMELFWELYQNGEIGRAQRAADRGIDAAQRTKNDLEALEQRVNQMMLVNMAMWSLIKEKTDLTEDDLRQRVQQIDGADGKIDGRIRPQRQMCPHCHQALSQKHNRCLRCGFEPPQGPDVFHKIVR